ncbi:uncharacterized protein LOC110269894 isoform X1 [Arachis ipaensis]|uniref:uncharacterized protein LOC110269894 isoform X1 n=1 Tax=Arachis ipaensis TaxID=130454 RepID=UPI000A2AFF43|nr:uncharacterized protein LOC110269894 isoform X1 [Arachis ipaensis]XP_025641868.1 uncharacterized protein LOC112736574 [Arachis hypogaea]XP_025685883.1 uncharacterized protein LOC112786724 isoform X1 [Arachis hypogaea]
MQQRSSSSSSRFTGDEHRAINIAAEQQQNQHTKRRKTTEDNEFLDGLPIYHLRTAAPVRRDFSSRSSRLPPEKWIHAIPALVLLCLFTLWWFSFPAVDVEINNGRITTIRQINMPLPNDSRIDLTILAVSTASPIPSIPQNVSSGEDETNLNPASSPN